MKNFLVLLAVLIIAMAVWRAWDYYAHLNLEPGQGPTAGTGAFPHLDAKIQKALADARNKGPASYKAALDRYKNLGWLSDPWLANYQLDYAVIIAINDPSEARKVFSEVAERTRPDSPVYPRVEQLRPTFMPSK